MKRLKNSVLVLSLLLVGQSMFGFRERGVTGGYSGGAKQTRPTSEQERYTEPTRATRLGTRRPGAPAQKPAAPALNGVVQAQINHEFQDIYLRKFFNNVPSEEKVRQVVGQIKGFQDRDTNLTYANVMDAIQAAIKNNVNHYITDEQRTALIRMFEQGLSQGEEQVRELGQAYLPSSRVSLSPITEAGKLLEPELKYALNDNLENYYEQETGFSKESINNAIDLVRKYKDAESLSNEQVEKYLKKNMLSNYPTDEEKRERFGNFYKIALSTILLQVRGGKYISGAQENKVVREISNFINVYFNTNLKDMYTANGLVNQAQAESVFNELKRMQGASGLSNGDLITLIQDAINNNISKSITSAHKDKVFSIFARLLNAGAEKYSISPVMYDRPLPKVPGLPEKYEAALPGASVDKIKKYITIQFGKDLTWAFSDGKLNLQELNPILQDITMQQEAARLPSDKVYALIHDAIVSNFDSGIDVEQEKLLDEHIKGILVSSTSSMQGTLKAQSQIPSGIRLLPERERSSLELNLDKALNEDIANNREERIFHAIGQASELFKQYVEENKMNHEGAEAYLDMHLLKNYKNQKWFMNTFLFVKRSLLKTVFASKLGF